MYQPLISSSVKDAEHTQRMYWQDIDLLQMSLDVRKDQPRFIFYEGPPTANGLPGLHHVVSRNLKDSICRYWNLKGYLVPRKGGWDTHGLPVEIEVEKKLGFTHKQQIEDYGIEAFNKLCRESVFEYESVWRELTERMGYLLDMDDPYITLEDEYIESGWWILKQFHDQGYMYKGYKILPYCSRCGTGLASHEVAQGYKDVKQETVTVAFKRKDQDEYFLVWTTTPWTLASNVVLTVHPEVTYVKAKQGEHVFILAKDLVQQVMGEDVTILEECKGKDLENIEYEQLMPFIDVDKRAFFVTLGDYVTTEDGTGIVHTAPAFGEEDYQTGLKYDLPVLQPVDLEGKYTATPWKGMFVMDADKHIVEWLRETGKLYKKQRVDHNYPHCWRCDTPLLYYANPSWYIKMSELRDQLVANNNTVNWYPAHVGEKRFGNWLENIKDWAISRDRYWGTQLNVWTCECGYEESIGSRKELVERSIEPIDENIELHRPFVDAVEIECPKCKGRMKREVYVVDVWFDSGAMPFAQMHYPFEHKDDFDLYYPADYVCEGIDQTRGWFYSLMAISTFIGGRSPYKNVLVNDHLLDKDGKKMSKSRGNTLDPFELFDTVGADTVRWYLSYVSPAWTPTKFDMEGLREVQSKFFGTLKNAYHLLSLYANNDQIRADELDVDPSQYSRLDRWILLRLGQTIEEVEQAYQEYDVTKVTHILQDFLNEDFSNWYIRRSRRRYWKEELDADKKAVYVVTARVLKDVCLMASPIAPFITEEIYRNLTGETSVHLAMFPKADPAWQDPVLEKQMDLARKVVFLGRSSREQVGIKVRQPLRRVLIDERFKDTLESMESIVLEELNVKQMEYVERPSDYVRFVIKPNFRVLGPQLGKNMGSFQKALREAEVDALAIKLREGEKVPFTYEGGEILLTNELVEIAVEPREYFTVEVQGNLFVILDTQISDDLRDEGYAREFVSRVQQQRKTNDYHVADRIRVEYSSTPEFEAAIESHRDFIMSEVLAEEMFRADVDAPEQLLNDQPTKIRLSNLTAK